MITQQETEYFDYCAVSPDKKHSDEWYCNRDCIHCKAGAQDGPFLWVGTEAPAQEHESLDAFVAKVEASGEDKKHKPLGYVDGYAEEWVANGWNPASSITISPTATHHVAIYTQAQRDAYAAEAVKQTDEEWRAALAKIGWTVGIIDRLDPRKDQP